MLGLGLALGTTGTRATGAPAALAFLPALVTPGARYRTVASTQRLIAGHVGPLAAVEDVAAGSGPVDVGAGRSGIVDADLPVGGASLARLYDQSGEGRDLTCATLAERPRLRRGIMAGGRPAILFVGHANDAARRSTLTGTATGSSGRRTDVLVLHPTTSRQTALFAEQFGPGGQVIDNLGTTGDGGHGRLAAGGVLMPDPIPSVPQVLVVVRDGATVTVWRDGAKGPTVPSPLGDSPLASVMLGADRDGRAYNASMRLGAWVAIDAAVSDVDAAAIGAALIDRFGIVPGFALNLVHLGDSIVEGVLDADTRGLGHLMVPLLGTATRYWNLGIAGKSLAAINADRADQVPALFAPGKRNVALIDGGINDLNAGPAATGEALYAQATTPLVGYLRGLGFAVGVTTILPAHTGRSYDDAAVNVQRLRYNAAVRANAAGADIVVDRAAEPRMGAYPAGCDDPALYGDALHPTSAGYALLAPLYAAALRALPMR